MATTEKAERLISATEMARQGRRPAIIRFQPTNYRKVESADLKKWEKLVLDRGGIHVTSAIGNAYYATPLRMSSTTSQAGQSLGCSDCSTCGWVCST